MTRTQVFSGVTYQCEKALDSGSVGLIHFFTIDLNTSGLELYVTPLDHDAAQAGWQYQTCWAPSIIDEQNLSILVNGTLYDTERSISLLPGDWARSIETVIAEHQVSHIDQQSYLLWFEDDLTPHLEKSKPPSQSACARARWGISGQGVLIDNGIVSKHGTMLLDRRTAIGINGKTKQLFIAVFDLASGAAAGQFLVERGVTDAIMLDGGDSTFLALGKDAQRLTPRTLVFPSRPLATVFGVRAPELNRKNR